MTFHAAVVARQMGKVCVAGCEAVEVLDSQTVKIGAKTFKEGDYLSINGSTGNVYEGDIPVVESEIIQVIQGSSIAKKSDKYQRFAMILSWADRVRKLRVRANADVPDQAKDRAWFRRGRDRPLSDGAYVLRRGSHPDYAEDDLGADERGAGKISRSAPAVTETGFHRALSRDGELSGHHSAT